MHLQILVFFPQSGQVQTPNVLMPSSIPSPQTMLPCQKTLMFSYVKTSPSLQSWCALQSLLMIICPKTFPAEAPFPLPHLGFFCIGPKAHGDDGAWLSLTPTLYWDTAWVQPTRPNRDVYTRDPVRQQPTLPAQHAPWGTIPHVLQLMSKTDQPQECLILSRE